MEWTIHGSTAWKGGAGTSRRYIRGTTFPGGARFVTHLLFLWLCLCSAPIAHAAPATQPSHDIELSPLVKKMLADTTMPAAEHRAFTIFHGRWDSVDHPTIVEEAEIAFQRGDFKNPALRDPSVPPLLRARAALERGEPEAVPPLMHPEKNPADALMMAQALEQLGRVPEAIKVLTPWRDRLQDQTLDNAPDLTAATEGMAMLARLEGRPARDYQLIMSLLGKARELDRLYWPADVAEARVLIDKDNGTEASQALLDALTLNPRASEAWLMLGELATAGYDFDRAGLCVEQLRKINPHNPLADTLEAEVALQQKDIPAAKKSLGRVLSQYPDNRKLLALRAAEAALAFDDPALKKAMDRFDALSPGNPLAAEMVGQYLSEARQYHASEVMLRRAIALAPNWPQPHVDLGLLLMQSGDEANAEGVLQLAAKLDPFNRRAANQLKLVQQILGYATVRTDHFIVKYKPGIDEVLAEDMPAVLEQIYKDITTIFEHKPARTTLIEILPDERAFGVRITGTPDIWTIAASTGDVIALTPPRQGAHQRGSFDWARVIRHEFVHTVTLDQTSNRVPHWFTEACAVSQEPGQGRDYSTCQLLAMALRDNKLFKLDQIDWAFIRPRTPRDRPLAYAQSEWMLEYITATYGHDAVIKLLTLFNGGASGEDAIAQVTGKAPDVFLAEFKVWAEEQVRSWGLQPRPDDKAVAKLFSGSNPPDAAQLQVLLTQHPDHPALLRLAAERSMQGDDAEAAHQAVLRYAASRPVDPWSDEALVALATRTHRPEEAIASLEQLDRTEQETGAWAHQLAEVYRAQGQLDQAAEAADRSLQREPYNPGYRELAATIALQRNDTDAALRHLRGMTIVEPDKAVHFVRLAALCSKLGRKDEAKAAAMQARKLDPGTDVERFIKG